MENESKNILSVVNDGLEDLELITEVDRVVKTLKESGVWDKLDCFYFLGGPLHNGKDASINWIDPK